MGQSESGSNLRDHHVSFEEAKTVFIDEHALLIDDPGHSEEEERLLLLGISFNLRMLVVVHCYRESDEIIRIISARKATRTEQKTYNQRWKR